MLQRLIASTLLLGLTFVSAPSAGEKKDKSTDNPFRRAKVGEFACYKMVTKRGFNELEGTMKLTVLEKTTSSLKLQSIASVMGVEAPATEAMVDLTKPFEIGGAIFQTEAGTKFEKVAEGTARIKVGGKEYESTWITGKVLTRTASGFEFDSEVKVWLSKDIPLNGVLRMETKARLANILFELTEYGTVK